MNVLCHHCYRLFPYPRIRVRCTSPRCADVLDTAGRRSARRMLPDREGLWAKKGRHLDLERPCPYCEEKGRLAPACPHCWKILDREAGKVEDRMIAVLGARQAGKSHFLAALLHQLLSARVGEGAWEVEIKPEMRRVAERELLRPLFQELRELPATPVGSDLDLRFMLHHEDGRRVLLRFQDLSGEVMADRAKLAKVGFLRYASGVILLADPLAFAPPARGRRKEWHHDEPDCVDILESYRHVLEAAPRRDGEDDLPILPERKYLAVAVTKADLVLHRAHAFWHPPADGAHLASGFWGARRAESDAASEWLRGQLEAPYVLDETADLFADVSYFFVSSYGYAHKPHVQELRKRPTPLRVHEPIFALLDRFESGAAAESRPEPRSEPARPHQETVDEEHLL